MQQNNKCRLCSDRDKMINYIISEYSKLVQKEYKTWHDWVGKVIYLELCKKLKYDHMNKWYMHKPESILENEICKIFWDFEIQTDHLILARWPDFMIVNKKKRTIWIMDFAVSVDHRVKIKENEKKESWPC